MKKILWSLYYIEQYIFVTGHPKIIYVEVSVYIHIHISLKCYCELYFDIGPQKDHYTLSLGVESPAAIRIALKNIFTRRKLEDMDGGNANSDKIFKMF